MSTNVVERVPPRFVDERWFIRFLEIVPGATTWIVLVLPVILSLLEPVWVAYFIIAFDLYWMIKSFRLAINLLRGYSRLHAAQKIDWNNRLVQLHDIPSAQAKNAQELEDLVTRHPSIVSRWWGKTTRTRRKYQALLAERERLEQLREHEHIIMNPDDVYCAVIFATVNEPLDIVEPSIRAMTDVDFNLKQTLLVIAYEERGGEETEKNVRTLIERYGDRFGLALGIKHPDGRPMEGRVKGANISYAARELTAEMARRKIDPERVILTTFDCDHRPSKNYFSYLTYAYATDPNRVHKSYQPIPMFYNNIWDAPAPMRVIATGNTFWLLMETMRPHRLRNFAAHAQSLAALIATDYWSVTSIVEDGFQFWRTYFTFDGDHEVVPIYTPVFQDAVLAATYLKTFKAQFYQLRRWAWGVGDFEYVVRMSIANRKIPWSKKLVQMGRLFEGHFSWATAPLLLTFVAWLPLYLNRRFSYQSLAHTLPIITSRILTLTSVTILITALVSLISLPPKPKRYHGIRYVPMALQWVLLPVTGICFSAFAAINAQTRLMFGKYVGFYVTEKATKK